MLERCIDGLIGAAQLQKNVEMNIILGAFLLDNKKKWCPAGGKGPLFGRVDGFQIDPKIFKKDFNCLKGMEFI